MNEHNKTKCEACNQDLPSDVKLSFFEGLVLFGIVVFFLANLSGIISGLMNADFERECKKGTKWHYVMPTKYYACKFGEWMGE